MFDPTSRYAGLEVLETVRPDGVTVTYVRRRFLPQGSSLPLLAEVFVTGGDRIDLVTARTLGEPTHFWRVADANDAMDPGELLEVAGTVIRIPVPQG